MPLTAFLSSRCFWMRSSMADSYTASALLASMSEMNRPQNPLPEVPDAAKKSHDSLPDKIEPRPTMCS